MGGFFLSRKHEANSLDKSHELLNQGIVFLCLTLLRPPLNGKTRGYRGPHIRTFLFVQPYHGEGGGGGVLLGFQRFQQETEGPFLGSPYVDAYPLSIILKGLLEVVLSSVAVPLKPRAKGT